MPRGARDDALRRVRHQGIAKSLFSISLVAGVMFAAYLLARGRLSVLEYAAFAGAIVTPLLGALLIRATGSITAGLLATNAAGVAIVALWAYATGGIASVALPVFLANLALLATFGNSVILFAIGGLMTAVLVALYVATVSDALPPSAVPGDAAPLLMLVSMCGAVIVIVLAAALVLRDRSAAKEKLRAARDSAERASRAKTEFLSSMSHELRTPLTTIIGAAEVLRIDRQSPFTTHQAEFIGHIADAGEHLLLLVNQVLDMNAIEAGVLSLRLEEVSAGDAIESCLRMIEPLAHDKAVRLHRVGGEPAAHRLLVDRTRFKQVLINLLSNAVKYNRPSGTVTVNCEARADGYLRISVADTGRGISAARQKDLFSPFSRLGAETGPIEGSGLGLAITKRLTEMMGGRIGFVSAQQAGSTFWVEFPSDAHGLPA